MEKKVFSAYTEIWVVFRYGDYDISEVITDKALAETKCSEQNALMEKHSYPATYKVMSLDEAISMIKDYVRNETERDCANRYYDEQNQ